jgi:hypothetical protein
MNDLIDMHGIKRYQNNWGFSFGHLLDFVLRIIFIAYKNKTLCCCCWHYFVLYAALASQFSENAV